MKQCKRDVMELLKSKEIFIKWPYDMIDRIRSLILTHRRHFWCDKFIWKSWAFCVIRIFFLFWCSDEKDVNDVSPKRWFGSLNQTCGIWIDRKYIYIYRSGEKLGILYVWNVLSHRVNAHIYFGRCEPSLSNTLHFIHIYYSSEFCVYIYIHSGLYVALHTYIMFYYLFLVQSAFCRSKR